MDLLNFLRQTCSRTGERRQGPRRAGRPNRRNFFIPHIEGLESRLSPAVFRVVNGNDSGSGSLRQAILNSNATPGPNTIDIAVRTIRPTSALPVVTEPVLIDGSPINGAELDGSLAGKGASGLRIAAGNSTVNRVIINSFSDAGIVFEGKGGNRLIGSFIGTDATGKFGRGNGTGVVLASDGNTIGSGVSKEGNGISGNYGSGVLISGNYNLLVGNAIGGISKAGLSNRIGVEITGQFNTIGLYPVSPNAISGNTDWGVDILGPNNILDNNVIGTDFEGTYAIPNGNGVRVASDSNTIGVSTYGGGNQIAGNLGWGFLIASGHHNLLGSYNCIGEDITGSLPIPNYNGVGIMDSDNQILTTSIAGNLHAGVILFEGATRTTILNSSIGTNDGATFALPNEIGLIIRSSDNIIGSANFGNVISGNKGTGIALEGGTGLTLQGNIIGLDVTGSYAIPNDTGIVVTAGGNLIGGDQFGNVISGNYGAGIYLADGTNTTIQGNLIGTDVHGAYSLPNGTGIFVAADGNTIGGSQGGDYNLISGNAGPGVYISGRDNLVAGNLIGSDLSETTALGNYDGVVIDGPDNIVGGPDQKHYNVIVGNVHDGIQILAKGPRTRVQSNLIGVVGVTPMGNGGNGITVLGSDASIGGTTLGEGNVIAYNGNDGVRLEGGAGNVIRGNSIFGHNAGLGIQLMAGSNRDQEMPVLLSTISGAGETIILGSLTSTPNLTFTIDFYLNQVSNPSGFGEGRTHIGFVTVTTDFLGIASISAIFSFDVPLGQFIAATATSTANDTSEFSLVSVVGAGDWPGANRTPIANALRDRDMGAGGLTGFPVLRQGGSTGPANWSGRGVKFELAPYSRDLYFGGLEGNWRPNVREGRESVLKRYPHFPPDWTDEPLFNQKLELVES